MAEEIIHIKAPLDEKTVLGLRTGQKVLFDGVFYSARDASHKRLIELIEQGKPLPFDLQGQVIYYVGPTPARPGQDFSWPG